MYTLGHVTNPNEAIALYDEYDIPYQVMKKNGEVRAKMSSYDKSYIFRKDVERVFAMLCARDMLDHVDICENRSGDFVWIASPYSGPVTKELQEGFEQYGYQIAQVPHNPYL